MNNDSNVEFGLEDLARFFKANWKDLITFSLCGVILCALIYQALPKKFNLSMQIKVGQYAKIFQNDLQFINIENPKLVAAQLASSTFYNTHILKSCGLSDTPENRLSITRLVTTNIPKGITDVIEVNFLSTDKSNLLCLQSIFDQIKKDQRSQIDAVSNLARQKMSDLNSRLEKNKEILEKTSQLPLGSWAYFFNLDEMRRIYDNLLLIETLLLFNESSDPKLIINPHLVSDEPITPNLKKLLLVGGLLGFFLVPFRKYLNKLKIA